MLYNKKHYTQEGTVGEILQVPKDDLLDVLELTNALQHKTYLVLKDSPIYLAMPALMSATIKSMLHQCESAEEARYYADIFISLFVQALKGSDLK
jgi:hypothetical protein